MEKNACCCGGKKGLDFTPLDAILDRYAGKRGMLITILQEAQDVYGYLAKDVIIYIGRKLNIPVSEIYGVATFYSQFHLTQRGKNIIRVCQGTACHVRGGAMILKTVEELLGISAGETTDDLNFTIEPIACIGACGMAPVMTVNDEPYGRLTPELVKEIIDKYR